MEGTKSGAYVRHLANGEMSKGVPMSPDCCEYIAVAIILNKLHESAAGARNSAKSFASGIPMNISHTVYKLRLSRAYLAVIQIRLYTNEAIQSKFGLSYITFNGRRSSSAYCSPSRGYKFNYSQ